MFGRAALVLLYVLVLMVATGIPVLVGNLLFEWTWSLIVVAALIWGNIAVFLSLRLLSDNKYVINGETLNVISSGRSRRVLFTSVVRVERVRHRVKSRVQEWVRVVYQQGNRQKRVEADLFVTDLISRCPQLTRFNQRKLPNLSLEDDEKSTGLPSAVLVA
ncbi:hypothetical protein OAN94_09700 [Verrucomicrobiales bacterium]|nr:hypothetical protein [Verrucomicrobiales bacterium]